MSEHQFEKLTGDALEEHFSNFLMDSFSYSKVATFARNEKDFERQYIYCEPYKVSDSGIAGNAYHEALEIYFKGLKDGVSVDLQFLEQKAFEYIDAQPATVWKLSKTNPTIEKCIQSAYKNSTAFLKNFYAEKSLYENEIKEVISVEEYLSEWVTINGVDIPIPCNMKIDLIFKNHQDQIVIVDHKTKRSYTDEQEAKFVIGQQAITYTKGYEKKYDIEVAQCWFVENKGPKNKNGDPQLKPIIVELDKDTRRLYEAQLYEPIKKMIEAISNPDHVYIINNFDNLADKAELYEFWARTMISEVAKFPTIPENKVELIEKRIQKIKDSSLASISPKIIKNFKANASEFIVYNLDNKDMTPEQKIEHVLKTLAVQARVAKTFDGYSSNTYLLEVGAGTKISSLFKYRLDIANALSVPNVRMMNDLHQYEGKSYFCFEVSKQRTKDVIWDSKYLDGMKIPIGKDNLENVIYWDLENHSTPHMLISGATGSGKSVSIKSTIEYAKAAGIQKIVILDPKFEFCDYNSDSKVQVYNEILDIEEKMKKLVDEMNEKVKAGKTDKILIIFDEFGDAVAQARKGKELDIKEMVQVGFYKAKDGLPPEPKMKLEKVGELKSLEQNLKILLQKGRSSGFRIISATQRASTKVITGDAKTNFPVQVCFRVPKEIDSRVVLDEGGAELLQGLGDGLLRSPSYLNTVRFQGFFKK